MLSNARACANIPTSDLERARHFYGQALGLKEADFDVEGGAVYQAGGGTMLHVYERPDTVAEHTVATFFLENLEETMTDLRSREVSFVEYDTPELTTKNGVFSDDSGFKAAWIKDPDGNILSLEQLPDAEVRATD